MIVSFYFLPSRWDCHSLRCFQWHQLSSSKKFLVLFTWLVWSVLVHGKPKPDPSIQLSDLCLLCRRLPLLAAVHLDEPLSPKWRVSHRLHVLYFIGGAGQKYCMLCLGEWKCSRDKVVYIEDLAASWMAKHWNCILCFEVHETWVTVKTWVCV